MFPGAVEFPSEWLTRKTQRIKVRAPVYIIEGNHRGEQGWIRQYVGDDAYMVVLAPPVGARDRTLHEVMLPKIRFNYNSTLRRAPF